MKIMGTNKKKTSRNKRVQKKNDSFVWTRPGFFTLAIVFVLALVWAFILGILVGRGYHPEAYIPGLSMLFSHSDKNINEKQSVGSSDKKNRSVLRSEELGFYQELTRSSRRGKSKLSSSSAKEYIRNENTSDPNDGVVYKYVYQVAAFQTKEPAEALYQSLKDKGYQVITKQIKKDQRVWYRVFVPFKGLPEEAERFKNKLAGLGGTNPFIRQKEKLE